ncbi:MAG TPA: hypothetical protein VGL83_04605 [Stellaceae bacterium]|jgi:outer membrane protein assembly factor BamB
MTKPFLAAIVIASALLALPSMSRAAGPTGEVLSYHADAARSGDFVIPNLTPDRARGLHPDSAFHAAIAGHVYAQPLFWHPDGGQALVLVATEDDTVYALDAASGQTAWQRSLGKPVPRAALPCGNIDPLGITGTPVIDPRGQAIYLDAMIMGAAGQPEHAVFGLSLRDGSVLSGWPVDVGATVSGFTARNQNQRAALALLGDSVYVGFGGHFGDCASYHGWVVGAKLAAPHQLTSWRTAAQAGAIWAPAGISSDGTSLYIATGNTMDTQQWSDGEAVIRLPPDLRFSNATKDYFAPSDWRALDARDQDLGGVAPALLDVPEPNGAASMVLALGKDGKAYLLDGRNLGGIGHALATRQVSSGPIRTATAAFPVGDATYVAFEARGTDCPADRASHDLTVLKITAAPPAIATVWCGAIGGRGAPIVTTTDGHSNPIVWMLGAEGDDRLYGFRGDTGERLVVTGAMRGLRHFETLIATPDRLYVAGDSALYAFAF